MPKTYNYQIKVMKWGLIPFWTRRSPEYGSMLRTINCRDDSLMENRGMWNTMKQRKRCVVVAQGFYEWLKKGPGGKEKIPHFVKRKDGNLMCFAGLWDCVRYEDSPPDEPKLYTYTIITTDSNKQLSFLHDRMPVILDPGTDEIQRWLDPTQNKWSRELQAMLKPFEGELECYPVDTAVGKVGNNSASFIVPIDSKENKRNIANFFGNAAAKIKDKKSREEEKEDQAEKATTTTIEQPDDVASENNAPRPLPVSAPPSSPLSPPTKKGPQSGGGQKRPHADDDRDDGSPTNRKQAKLVASSASPTKSAAPAVAINKKPRSATSNKDQTLKSSPAKKVEPGTQRITNFFTK